MRMRDVVIVGGGPAGLMAARTLGQFGHDAVVLEEHDEVGVPVHCTGIIGLDAFDELNLSRATVLGVAQSARFHAADGNTVAIESDQIRAAIVDRQRFDATLATEAVAAGATVRTGVRVARLETSPEQVRLWTSTGEAQTARACVLACGASDRFNRQLGFGVPRVFVQSAQCDIPFPPLDKIEVHLDRQLSPGGFAWAVPFRRGGQSRVKLGLLSDRHAAAGFATFARTLAVRMGEASDDWPKPRMKMLPLGPVKRTYATRVLAVGDAAGLVKPTTGGGIYYGLLSGSWAAETLDVALRRDQLDARRLRTFETRWRDRLGPEIRAGLAFRTISSRLDDNAISTLIDLANVDGLVPMLKQTANFNWHRDAALALLRNTEFRKVVLSSLWS
jgi:digeranylgeranylglycerophospholipid reductase